MLGQGYSLYRSQAAAFGMADGLTTFDLFLFTYTAKAVALAQVQIGDQPPADVGGFLDI